MSLHADHILSVILALTGILFCIHPSGAEQVEKIKVVVSILPETYLVERVGGDRVEVTNLVSPGQSPHTYEPTPKQIASLSKADLYFRIGIQFEDSWMDKIASIYPRLRILDLRRGITLRDMEAHDHSESEKEHRHSDQTTLADIPKGKDPHIWMSPKNAAIMSQTICDALCERMPEKIEYFNGNLDSLLVDLLETDRKIREILSPLSQKRFMVYHPSWGYFADEYGLEQVSIEVEGKAPGAKALASVIEEARTEGIKVIFVSQQFSPTNAETVAEAIGGKVVPMDPLSPDYLNNLVETAKALAEGSK